MLLRDERNIYTYKDKQFLFLAVGRRFYIVYSFPESYSNQGQSFEYREILPYEYFL
jgi:hypothetical protein